jgi:adenine-specific DNA-methyltransferase
LEVTDYRHRNEKRKNNPDAGLASYNYKLEPKVKYSHDPHLDPQLVWSGKAERTSFEVESVSLHIHERISTRAILDSIRRVHQWRQERLFAEPELPFDERIEFYQHEMEWANRLILGDSLLVMTSLLERELVGGKVQMIYMDPPYGIAYNSNFQPSVTNREVKDGHDDFLTREPEQIKAYRDTWQLGIHSYLTYLRDRLLICRELLQEGGSIFVQISDENLHRVRSLLDEVFGSDNFVALITIAKTSSQSSKLLASICDYVLWYAKSKDLMKYRQVYQPKVLGQEGTTQYTWVENSDGRDRRLDTGELANPSSITDYRVFACDNLTSQSGAETIIR